MESSTELILIPAIAAGHLVPAVELAKLLVAREPRLYITVLLLKLPFESAKNPTVESLSSSVESERIKFVDLPRDEPPSETTLQDLLATFYESQTRHVRDALAKILSSGSARVVGFVLDMICTAMIDVADEFGVPSYVFFTCGAAMLSLTFHLLGVAEKGDLTEALEDELVVPGFTNPIPKAELPSTVLNKAWTPMFLSIGKGIARAKGVLVNTFEDLEPGMIKALSTLSQAHQFPPVFPVGPVISSCPGGSHAGFGGTDRKAEIMEWLDGQPASSVVFLCFGSLGSFEGDQVREIAFALERTGVRFLWSLRRPVKIDSKNIPTPTEYENPAEVLPEGFLERTAEIGKVVGWAPQVTILGHPAMGGFVSHCGWNSILESVSFGVLVATWPLYAEQRFNAFEMVTELGLAVEIEWDNWRDIVVDRLVVDDSGDIAVKSEQIEIGIKKLMESESDVKKRIKEMSEKSRKALLSGGSSNNSLTRFINEIII